MAARPVSTASASSVKQASPFPSASRPPSHKCSRSDFTLEPSADGVTGSVVLGALLVERAGLAPCDVQVEITVSLVHRTTGQLLKIPNNPLKAPVAGTLALGGESVYTAPIVWGEPFCPVVKDVGLSVADNAGHHATMPVGVTPRCDPTYEHGSGPGLALTRRS